MFLGCLHQLALAECVAAIVDGVQTFQVGSLALLQNKAFVADSVSKVSFIHQVSFSYLVQI